MGKLEDMIDRGIHMRSHPSLHMDIIEVVGKPDPNNEGQMIGADPGLYYNAHGIEVSKELAGQAGFPIEDEWKQHLIKIAMEEAGKEVLTRFGENKNEVVEERAGFKIMDIGVGRCNVVSPDGAVLNAKGPLTLAQAKILMSHLAPVQAEDKKREAEKK